MSQLIYSALQSYSTYPTSLLITSNAGLIPTTPSNNIMRTSQSKTPPNSADTVKNSRRLVYTCIRAFATRSYVPKVGSPPS
jgi:hypothetical protein